MVTHSTRSGSFCGSGACASWTTLSSSVTSLLIAVQWKACKMMPLRVLMFVIVTSAGVAESCAAVQ